ncbi:MAG TPA: protein kinase [Steroidobacteraceae bacterium]
MDVERERRALQHLEDALLWPSEEREQRLASALQHDPQMLTDVRELLRSAGAVNESFPTSLRVALPEDLTPPPEHIGPYRIVELLGSGGMGRVYRAERADGAFQRTVALKLMRRTHLPTLVAAQFARERQILASLQHRNIAQLFDGGVTPDGHSYFVMELVSGRPVTTFAAEKNLTLRETLQLFGQICTAVQFAHAHLVVHADIKPSNAIVDEDGVAKLLDFGVARVLASAGEEESPVPLGLTVKYASPARQRGDAPTTLDDVYSLGVLLEELLERFPGAPSDLRAISHCARASDPTARYASVEAVHADIRRWLSTLPVRAYHGNWRYGASKFLWRYRLVVVSAAAAFVLVVGAAVALALLYMRAEHARVQAEQARAKAEERFADLRELSRFVLFDVYDRLESIPRALALRRDLADAGQRYLDRLAQDPEAPADVRLDVIEGLRRIARVQAAPGDPSLSNARLAHSNLDRAEALAQQLPNTGADRGRRAVILSRIALARATLSSFVDSDFAAATRSLEESASLLDDALRVDPVNPDALALQDDLAIERAYALQWQGEYAKAIDVTREALARPGPVMSTHSSEFERAAQLRRARLLDRLAESTYYAGNAAAAEQPYREELSLLQAYSASAPNDVNATRRVQRAEWALGSLLTELNRPAEAETILAHSVAMVEQLQLLEPEDKDLARLASVTANAYGDALVALKKFSQAFPIYERSLAMRRKRWDDAPNDWGAARDYAMALGTLGDARAAAGRTRQACADYAETLDVFDRMRAAGRLAKLDEENAVRNVRSHVATYCKSQPAQP